MSVPFALLRSMRPRQWVKNVFVFAALVFGQRITDPSSVARSGAAFVIFCLLSSAVYLINDIADRSFDRRHPVKRRRPIASGELPLPVAGIAAALLALGALAWALFLGPEFAGVALLYLVLNLAYSLGLKNVVILDVILISIGFLIRAWAGAVAIGVGMSHWLVLCTGMLSLFLGFVKRRQEIETLGSVAEQRPILREYSVPFLDQMIGIVTASTVLAYALYALSDEVAQKLDTQWMGLTLPFVLYGIFRYLYLAYRRGFGENPSALVVSDAPLVVTILLWAATVLVALYVL
jgi:4-hydroxybenzoate polyprenyltransferase